MHVEPDESAERRASIEARLGIFEALVSAADNRDEVFQIISSAEGADEAVRALQDRLHIGEDPAHAILDAQLRRFTSRERARLVAIRDEIRTELGRLG